MTRKMIIWMFLIAGTAVLSGCATAPKKQIESTPVYAEPAPVVQSGPSQEEIERMRQQLNDQQAALAQAEADKRALEEKLDSALATKKSPAAKTADPYLK